MNLMHTHRPWSAVVIASVASVGLLIGSPFARAEAPSQSSASQSQSIVSVDATTEPLVSSKLAFPNLGVIKEVLVKDGDVIKKGDVLIRQDDDLDLNELEQLKLQAESNTKIEAAAADYKAKQAAYDRKKKIFDEGNGSQSELEEAEADMINRQKQLQQAKEDKAVAQLKYEQQKVKIEKMKIFAPFDGAVQKVIAQVGESTSPQNTDGAIEVVNNNPLKIVVRKFTTRQASTMKLGDKLQVRFVNDGADAWQDASVSYIAPRAIAAGDVQEVYLELPNQKGRSSGEHVAVKLTPKLIETMTNEDATAMGQ
jgi:HlyD family secretion protein